MCCQHMPKAPLRQLEAHRRIKLMKYQKEKYLVSMFWFTGLKRPRLLGKANAITRSFSPSSSFFPLLYMLSMGSWSGMSFWPCGTSWPGCVPSQFPLVTVAAQKPEKAFGSVLALLSNSRTTSVITHSALLQSPAPCEGNELPQPHTAQWGEEVAAPGAAIPVGRGQRAQVTGQCHQHPAAPLQRLRQNFK